MDITRQRPPITARQKKDRFKKKFLQEVRRAYLDENPGALLDQVLDGFTTEQKTLHLLRFVQNRANLHRLGDYLKTGKIASSVSRN